MSIFDAFKKKSNPAPEAVPPTPAPASSSEQKVSLEKKVNLAKEDVQKVCLTKKPLNGLVASVGLVLDYSGSMRSLYENGVVQDTVEKALPLAMTFDDNQSMEVWIFDDSFHRLPDITLDNLAGYVQREIMDKGFIMGCTEYAPVMDDVVKTYKNNKVPAYILFLTDGDNSDHNAAKAEMIKASKRPIFWQFVGLGRGPFNFLQTLDDMGGRYVDNADFFSVKEAENIQYKDLLNEFPEWLENEKVKKML